MSESAKPERKLADAINEFLEPTIARMVIYRTRAGVDIAALITALVDDGPAAHLEQFPPPGVSADHLSYEWGADYSAEPERGTWRWPERVEAKPEKAKP